MAEKTVFISHQQTKPIKILKWKVTEGNTVPIGSTVLFYDFEGGERKEQKRLKCTKAGTIRRLLAQEGAIVKPGEHLFELESCVHPTVMKDMCAECGADLRKDDVVTAASVPMVHSIPELKVSEEQAQKLGKADNERLLKDRKLALLVDLDQTLIHTTNDNVPPNMKNVYHFQLYGPQSPWYHTRLRPGTHKFLNNVYSYFELHICTFGARNYAHKITQFLDQDEKFFSNRILSRDECFDPTSKKANLKALFPCGDNMVCIIDDREDVWSYATNLIHVKPYHFFQHTGDINAPPGLEKHESDEKGVDLTQRNNSKSKKAKITEKQSSNKTLNNGSIVENVNKDKTNSGMADVEINVNSESENAENNKVVKEKEEVNIVDTNTSAVNNSPEVSSEDAQKDLSNPPVSENQEKGDTTAAKGTAKEDVQQEVSNSVSENQEKENTKASENTAKEDAQQDVSNPVSENQEKENSKALEDAVKEDAQQDVSKHVDKNQGKENSKGLEDTAKDDAQQDVRKPVSENEEKENSKAPEDTAKEDAQQDVSNTPVSENQGKEDSKAPEAAAKEDELEDIEDPDDYLLHLEDILIRIHRAFYEEYDKLESGEVPDLKMVIPEVKSRVLQGAKLVFSGLVPTHMNLEQSKAYQVAKSLGAEVTQDLRDDTTHLVAVRPGTAKVNAGRRRKNIKIVTPDWLWACAEWWEHVDERLYVLSGKGSKNRHPPPHCSSPEHIPSYPVHDMPASRKRSPSGRFMDTINPLMSFSSADIADMDKEVDNILDDESESDEPNEANNETEPPKVFPKSDDESSSSSGESLTGEHIRGHKRKRGAENNTSEEEEGRESSLDEFPSTRFRRGEMLESDLDFGQDSNSEKSEEPMDDVDDGEWNMMGAALEREFLSNN